MFRPALAFAHAVLALGLLAALVAVAALGRSAILGVAGAAALALVLRGAAGIARRAGPTRAETRAAMVEPVRSGRAGTILRHLATSWPDRLGTVMILALLLRPDAISLRQFAVLAGPAFLISWLPHALVVSAFERGADTASEPPSPAADALDRRMAGAVGIAFGAAGLLVLASRLA